MPDVSSDHVSILVSDQNFRAMLVPVENLHLGDQREYDFSLAECGSTVYKNLRYWHLIIRCPGDPDLVHI